MAVINRDMFPPHIMQRIQTPIHGRAVVGSLQVCRDRPWGGILYPEAQQQDTPKRRRRNG